MTATAILPGARVRTRAGILGTVERVEPVGVDQDARGSLLVRAHDGTRHYRVPLPLVTGVAQEADHAVSYTVVSLALDSADFDRYVVRDDASQSTVVLGDTLHIPLAAEELVTQTRPVQRGSLQVHKSVETVEQRLTVPLTHEEVIVERIPADQYDSSAPPDPDETIIPVVEERLVVETRAVIVEYVRVRTRRVTKDQEVRAPLRREVVTVTEMETAAGRPDPPLTGDAGDDGRPDETER